MRRVFLLGLLLVAAAVLFPGETERASAQQTQGVLVSNTGQGDSTSTNIDSTDIAQAFTTGSNGAGYTLTSVDVEFEQISDAAAFSTGLTVTINSDSSGNPGAVVGTLTNPADQTFSTDTVLTFTAPGDGIELEADTTYYVMVGHLRSLTGTNLLRPTASDNEDSTGESDWSIANTGNWRSGGVWLPPVADSYKIGINGYAKETVPTLISNIEQADAGRGSWGVDHAQEFRTGSVPAGYVVTAVDVEFAGVNDPAALSTKMTATIRGKTGSGVGALVGTLTNPPDQTFATDTVLTFTAPEGGIELDPDTSYYFVLDVTQAISGQTQTDGLRNTNSDAEDSGGLAGFSIADDSLWRTWSDATNLWTIFADSKKIHVKGHVSPGTLECVTANADGAYLVPESWPLNPANSSPGDKFRLLFRTSTTGGAAETGIAHYNTLVQTAVKAGHESIGDSCGDLFRAVGSTSAVDARDNTDTTGTGVPIHWLGGAKLADDYADFYDGSWDSYELRDESGAAFTQGSETWTGSNDDGTKHSTNYLGHTSVVIGTPELGDNPLDSSSDSPTFGNYGYYGISPLFVVGPPTVSLSVKDGHTTIREGGTRTVVYTLDSPAPPGGIELGDPGVPVGGQMPVSQSLIPEGQTTLEITLTANDDDEFRTGGTVTLTYPNTGGLPVSGSLTVTLSVIDDDPPTDAFGTYTVPYDWALKPSGLGEGDTFRLMFQTSARRDATATDIAVYDAFVRGRAAAGHAAIRQYSDQFRVVGSTSNVDARDHLEMNPEVHGEGDPVYWLNGERIAEDNDGFWSATWENWAEADRRTESGSQGDNDWHWTGTAEDGRASSAGPLGDGNVVARGRFLVNTGDENPLNHTASVGTQSHSLYAMSPVFRVGNQDGSIPVFTSWDLVPSGLDEGDKFRLIFKTTGRRDATSGDIGVYNAFVQDHAAAGHQSIRRYASLFRVLASTQGRHARDNTDTAPGDPSHPIYWLNGELAASGNSRLWSNSWNNWQEADRRDEFGRQADTDWHWTGTKFDGQRSVEPLGHHTRATIGAYLVPGGSDERPMQHAASGRNNERSFMVLSPVFVVTSPTAAGEDTFSKPMTGTFVEFEWTEGVVHEASSCMDEERRTSIGRAKQNRQSPGPVSHTVTNRVRLGNLPASWSLPGDHYKKVTLFMDGGKNVAEHSRRDGLVDIEDDYPDTERLQQFEFTPDNYNEWQTIEYQVYCAGHEHDHWNQFPHYSLHTPGRYHAYANAPKLDESEPTVRIKVYDNKLPALQTSYDREVVALWSGDFTAPHEYVWMNPDRQWWVQLHFQWRQPGSNFQDYADATRHFDHFIAELRTSGQDTQRAYASAADHPYSSASDGDYDVSFRLLGLPERTLAGGYAAVGPVKYRLDITPVHKQGEKAPGAREQYCIEMRDVAQAGVKKARWNTVRIDCNQNPDLFTLPALSPPPTPEVNVMGTSAGPEGVDVTFILQADPAPQEPLDVTVEITTEGGDHGVSAGERTVTIPTSGWVTLDLPTVDDAEEEAMGSVTLTLKVGDGYDIGPMSWGRSFVSDNDAPGQLAPVLSEVNIVSGAGGSEGEDAVFVLEADPAPRDPLQVSVEVSAAGDYGVARGKRTVVIPTSGSLSLTVPTRDDKKDEADGSVTLSVQEDDGYTVGTQSSQSVDIFDNDLVVSVADAIAGEGDDLEFVISLSRAADREIEVYYVSLNGWAKSPDDFAFANGAAVFAPGETRKTVRVPTVDDGVDEGLETMQLDLSGIWAPGLRLQAWLGDSSAIGTISDDPVTPRPELSISSSGSGITEGGSASFTITASFAPDSPITVNVGVSQDGDFGASGARTVTLSGTTATYSITTHDDTSDEPNGSVTATLQSGSGYTVGSPSSATVAVSDDDLPPPLVSISGGNGITEGGSATFTITVSPAPTSPITVNVGVSQSGDFGASGASTVTLSGTTATYTITTTDDTTDEPNGSVTATLKSGQGYAVGSPSSATVTVSDDDVPPPTPEVNVTGSSGGEEGQDVTFTLTASPAPATSLPVRVTIAASGDYGVHTGTWVETIPSGGSVTVTLTTTDDGVDEPNGSATLTVEAGQGYTVGSLSSDTATITDNDDPQLQQDPEVSITAGNGITEGGAATFTITANPAPASPITVKVGVSENGDFGASGAATITLSGATATYTITTTDDSADEADGSVTATLQAGQGYTVSSSQGAATVNVSDNDVPEVGVVGYIGLRAGEDDEGHIITFEFDAEDPVPWGPLDVSITTTVVGDFGVTAETQTITLALDEFGVSYYELDYPTVDDDVDEPDGSVTVTINPGEGYVIAPGFGTATVAVEDNDDPTPEISITAGNGITEGGSATYTITANPAPASPITVKVGVSESGDFGANGASTVTLSGATATYTITTTDDSTDEADGSVTATLQAGQGYTVSSSQGAATVNVADNDVPEVSIAAGSGITEGGTASFTITANPVPASPITVKVGVSENGDFGASGAATVTLSGATATYTITTTDDTTDELDGSVTATLQAGQGYTVSSSQGAATVTVSDNDVSTDNSGTLTVSIADSESAGRGEFLRFEVSLSETAQQDVTITFSVWKIGNLVQGLDYCILPSGEEPAPGFRCMSLPWEHDDEGGELTIAAGEDSGTIYVWIDREAEVPSGRPYIYVNLDDVEGAREITDDHATGYVTDD